MFCAIKWRGSAGQLSLLISSSTMGMKCIRSGAIMLGCIGGCFFGTTRVQRILARLDVMESLGEKLGRS